MIRIQQETSIVTKVNVAQNMTTIMITIIRIISVRDAVHRAVEAKVALLVEIRAVVVVNILIAAQAVNILEIGPEIDPESVRSAAIGTKMIDLPKIITAVGHRGAIGPVIGTIKALEDIEQGQGLESIWIISKRDLSPHIDA